jgi:hypothetical protein
VIDVASCQAKPLLQVEGSENLARYDSFPQPWKIFFQAGQHLVA